MNYKIISGRFISLSFPLNGIRLDETVGNGLAHSVGEAAPGKPLLFLNLVE